MSYTYTWVNAEQTMLKRENGGKPIGYISASPDSLGYQEFLESGATAAPYVAPPEPASLTTEEKVSKLLTDYGLSREELKAVIYEEESN